MNTSTSIYARRQKAEWLSYLQAQTPPLSPADFGESSWAAVIPSPQRWDWAGNRTLPLPKKKLFYWSVRFSVHASAVAFARATKAMEQAFVPDVRVFSNFNNFHGRAYQPFGGANDGALLGEDMFEFGERKRPAALLSRQWRWRVCMCVYESVGVREGVGVDGRVRNPRCCVPPFTGRRGWVCA